MNKSTILKWVILTILAGYCCWMVVWGHQEAARHTCTGIEVEVTGKTMMDSVIKRGVLKELDKYPEPIKGVPLNLLNTHRIEQYLSGLSNFESVSCMVTSHGQLHVKVTPLVPVMRVFFADNSYYINKDGKHIASSPEFYTDVPVVSGRFTRDFQPKDVLPLLSFIKGDRMLRDLTNMIVAEGPNDLLIVPRIRGHVINFGDTTRLGEKRSALELFYKKVMPYKGWEEYDTISVKFRGQVVATRRDKTRVNHGEEDYDELDLEEGTLPTESDAPSRAESVSKPAANGGQSAPTPMPIAGEGNQSMGDSTIRQ